MTFADWFALVAILFGSGLVLAAALMNGRRVRRVLDKKE